MTFLAWFIILAIAELAVFLWVGELIGLGWTLGIALATAVIGSLLVRKAGVSVLGKIREKTRSGQLPGRELTHGAAVLVAGAFLITPGLITDTLGFLLLIPVVRDLVHRQVTKRIRSRWEFTPMNFQGAVFEQRDEQIIDSRRSTRPRPRRPVAPRCIAPAPCPHETP